MLGVSRSDRVSLLKQQIETLAKAWTGEPFDFNDVQVTVRPTPVQQPRPLLVIGSSVAPGARRAAHIGDGFDPPVSAMGIYEIYEEECRILEKSAAPAPVRYDMVFLHVSTDPERDWPILAPHILQSENSYAAWSKERGPVTTARQHLSDVRDLKEHPAYQVLTPQDCVDYLASMPQESELVLQPLIGGLPPKSPGKASD